jgi:LysM repeat protein
MSAIEPEVPSSRYGRERRCARCGTRVAQKAQNCFFCGALLDDARQRRVRIPWADIFLFLVIGAVLAFWWLRPPSNPTVSQLALAASPTSGAPTAAPEATATPSPTVTPRPTSTPSATATLLPTPFRHKVEPGDTIELIAGRYGSVIKDIIDANGLTADGFIRVGDELLVPLAGASGGPGPTATPAGGVLIYTVQPGDTVETIAMRFGSQVDWILTANQMQARDLLRIGQSLTVPLTAATPTPVRSATPAPIATFTPVVGFRAPILLNPADGSAWSGRDEIVLEWTAVGVLAKDQWYVVALKIAGASAQPAPFWTKSTSWRLPVAFRMSEAAAPEYTWQVQVVSGTPGASGQPISPASATRAFTWR